MGNYDIADQLLSLQSGTQFTTYSYDQNGSRIGIRTPAGVLTTYGWDPANRLQSTILPSGQITTETYRYDDLRFAQSNHAGIQTFIWAENNVLASLGTGASGAWSELFTHSDRLIRAVGNDSSNHALNRQYHLDALGTVQATTLGTQATEADFSTDAWGNMLSGMAQDNPHVYLGGLGYWHEPDLALNYVKARWLDSATGSWLSVDSVPTEPRYRYVNNMPTFKVDPSGMQTGSPIGSFAQGIQQGIAYGELLVVDQFNHTVIEPLLKGAFDPFFMKYKLWHDRQPLIFQKFIPPANNKAATIIWFIEFSKGYSEAFLGEVQGWLKGVYDQVIQALNPLAFEIKIVQELQKISRNPAAYANGVKSQITGAWQQAANVYQGAREFAAFLGEESVYFDMAGFSMDTFLSRYGLVEPLVQAIGEFATVETIPPYILGKILGWLAFHLMVQIITQIAALLTLGYGEVLELAEAGELGEIGEQLIQLNGAVGKAFQNLQKIQSAIHKFPNQALARIGLKLLQAAEHNPRLRKFLGRLMKLIDSGKLKVKQAIDKVKTRYNQIHKQLHDIIGKGKNLKGRISNFQFHSAGFTHYPLKHRANILQKIKELLHEFQNDAHGEHKIVYEMLPQFDRAGNRKLRDGFYDPVRNVIVLSKDLESNPIGGVTDVTAKTLLAQNPTMQDFAVGDIHGLVLLEELMHYKQYKEHKLLGTNLNDAPGFSPEQKAELRNRFEEEVTHYLGHLGASIKTGEDKRWTDRFNWLKRNKKSR